MSLSLSTDTQAYIKRLRERYSALKAQVQKMIEFPEASFRLDIESRFPDEVRMFKHIQQSCQMHSLSFVRANQIKLLYLIDAYLCMVKSENPIGVYSSARGLLEFNAYLFEVTRRLLNSCDGDEINWRSRGEQFFGVIIRARFASSDPIKTKRLTKAGVSKKHAKPFNVTECIKSLSTDSEFSGVSNHYDLLCDFVHHNLSSQTVSNIGTFNSDMALSSGGGALILKSNGPITRYEYPPTIKAVKALEETASFAIRNVKGSIVWLNRCPESAYSRSEIQKRTGTDFGMPYFGPNLDNRNVRLQKNRKEKIGRNDPCSCGSGKKHKRCCGE